MRVFTVLYFFVGGCVFSIAQNLSYSKHHYSIKKRSTQTLNAFGDTLSLSRPQEMPMLDGAHKYSALKKKQAKTNTTSSLKNYNSSVSQELPSPQIHTQFDALGDYVSALDTAYPITTSSQPLDNTIAVSKDGLLLSAINTKIFGYDLFADSSLFSWVGLGGNTYSFGQFSSINNGSGTAFPFDPKLLYDSNHDRFIFCFISGRDSADSKTVMAFSSSNDPRDPWYLYDIDGNPRNLNQWSDYPAISISENELFYTVNLIIDGVSWQEGFDGSLIWQMNLDSAYAGADSINLTLWDDIKHNNTYIRNLHPVTSGMGPEGDNMFFLSNRNFDMQNDTVFMLEITGQATDQSTELLLSVGKLDQPYGFPPNAKQADTDSLDPTTGLQTNDSRFLGAIRVEDTIQFVGNSVSFSTNRAGIYHGKITDIYGINSTFTGRVLSVDTLDFGYPNIGFTGKNTLENQAIISFEYSSVNRFAGTAAYYTKDDLYSDLLTIREGENIIDNPPLNNDPYERWGDYTGMQAAYDQMGSVWVCGAFGLPNKRAGIHIAKLTSSDSIAVGLNLSTQDHTLKLFPNPFKDDLYISFNLQETTPHLSIQVSDISGKITYQKNYKDVEKGAHEILLNAAFFSANNYIITIKNSDQILFSKKIIRP